LKPLRTGVPLVTAYHQYLWTISIHELMIMIFIFMMLKWTWKSDGQTQDFFPALKPYKIVGSTISQTGIWGRRIFSIWYGSISKSSLKDRILIQNVVIVFGLSKMLSLSFGLNTISNIGFAGQLLILVRIADIVVTPSVNRFYNTLSTG